MKLVSWPTAWDDYLYWQAEDPKVLARVNALLKECTRDPFRGTGKPEALKQNLSGWWSRRITGEHRLVYRVTGSGEAQALEVAQCRYHYRARYRALGSASNPQLDHIKNLCALDALANHLRPELTLDMFDPVCSHFVPMVLCRNVGSEDRASDGDR